MNLSCSSRAIKYLMFTFNFLFVITGITLIAVGGTIKSNYKQYDTVLDTKYFSLPNMLIATGILIFIISFLGCYGAMKESWIILMAFSILLGIIFIFEFSVGIAGYVLRDKTSSYLQKTFYDTILQYNNSETTAKMWDVIQSEFQCCGVVSPSDWNLTFQNDNLPISCCPRKFGAIGEFHCNTYITTLAPSTTTSAPTSPTTASSTLMTASTENPDNTTISASTSSTSTTIKLNNTNEEPPQNGTPIRQKRAILGTEQAVPDRSQSTTEPYQQGCQQAFGNFVKSHAVDIGAVGFVLAIIQVIGIAFSIHLARQLKNQYYST